MDTEQPFTPNKPPTPGVGKSAEKSMPKLERLSWIAGIVSAVLAVGALFISPWTNLPPNSQNPEFERKMKHLAARQERLMRAYENASYAMTKAGWGPFTNAQHATYNKASGILADALHAGQDETRDDEAVRLYAEAQRLFESLRPKGSASQ